MLTTEDLILDKAKYSDWKDMYDNVWSRPESAKYMLWELTPDEEGARRRIERTIAFQKDHDAFLVYERTSRRAIGFAGVVQTGPHTYEDTGICVGPDYVRKGYGKQIVQRLMQFCRDERGAKEFVYTAREENEAANALARSLGLSLVGVEDRTDARDGHVYRLLEYRVALQAGLYERFEFRSIRPEEAEEAADIEEVCFPPNEACLREHMLARIQATGDRFLVAVDRESGKLAGFLNGIATNEMSFRDEFFTDTSTHDPDGKNIMLLGLDVLPEYRRQGLGRELVLNYCRREEMRGIERIVLTCHEDKVEMYTKFGFRDLGESASKWGGEKWHEMEILLNG